MHSLRPREAGNVAIFALLQILRLHRANSTPKISEKQRDYSLAWCIINKRMTYQTAAHPSES